MQLNNICGFKDIDSYVKFKLDKYSQENKNFRTLFEFMFSESENVMAEISDGYKIKRISYGEFKQNIISLAASLKSALADIPKGSIVGIYMNNSVKWIEIFWATLMTGYSPLLMNLRLDDGTLESIIEDHSVRAIISDEKSFSKKTLIAKDIAYSEGAEMPDTPFGDEVIFMSSGTTDNVKLCSYTAENFYYQICDSANIIKKSPDIKRGFEGEIKQLVLLPLYHVFGFIAVYLWFGFFSRTFVFMKDMNPTTLINSVKKHKVTHIFAVPMVWDAIYKEAIRKIKAKGERTYKKFKRGLSIANSTGAFGKKFSSLMLGEIRENLFGDSIRCMISGGSHITTETLEFFNGIGYHLANGYGMTEIGITSVEVSTKRRDLNSASIGAPFGYTEYSLSEKGELLVRGKTMASKIRVGDQVTVTDFDKWFNTNDIARVSGSRYFLDGRVDDLIVCKNGENLNPVIAERKLMVPGCDSICLFKTSSGDVILLASSHRCLSPEYLIKINDALVQAVRDAKLEGEVTKIAITSDPLIRGAEFKISRKKVCHRYERGEFRLLNRDNIDNHIEEILTKFELSVKQCFAEALEKDVSEITSTANFFTELGGTSLDYFSLLSIVKNKFNIEFPSDEGNRLTTVKEFCDFIKKN